MIDDDREWLEGGGEQSGGTAGLARPEIVDSWRRSRLSGVNPDAVTIVPGEVFLDSRIAKVAIPVLGAMADILIGAKTSLLLSAPDGTMLWRWSENTGLSALLDRRSAVVGTRWNEDIVGTNGLGTALETTRPVMISGSEHFSASLHEFTCAGAPIRHPITRRVAGVLSVTSLVKDASPLMAPTLIKLVREVEEQLYSDSTLRERELLHHFLAERRHGRNAVVAVSEDVVIANKAGPGSRWITGRSGRGGKQAARWRRDPSGGAGRHGTRPAAGDRTRGFRHRTGHRRRAGWPGQAVPRRTAAAGIDAAGPRRPSGPSSPRSCRPPPAPATGCS